MFCLNDVKLANIYELTKTGKGELYIAVKTESAMTTYYYSNPEEALRQARIAGKRPGCYYGGITLPSGKKVDRASRKRGAIWATVYPAL